MIAAFSEFSGVGRLMLLAATPISLPSFCISTAMVVGLALPHAASAQPYPSTQSDEQAEGLRSGALPEVGEVSKSRDRLSRCAYRTRTTLDGREDREAVCVFENEAGSMFLVTVRVFCDEGCRPVGSPTLTEFYE